MAIFSAPEDNGIWFSQPPPQPRRQIRGTVMLPSPSFTLTFRRTGPLPVPEREHEPCALVPGWERSHATRTPAAPAV